MMLAKKPTVSSTTPEYTPAILAGVSGMRWRPRRLEQRLRRRQEARQQAQERRRDGLRVLRHGRLADDREQRDHVEPPLRQVHGDARAGREPQRRARRRLVRRVVGHREWLFGLEPATVTATGTGTRGSGRDEGRGARALAALDSCAVAAVLCLYEKLWERLQQ